MAADVAAEILAHLSVADGDGSSALEREECARETRKRSVLAKEGRSATQEALRPKLGKYTKGLYIIQYTLAYTWELTPEKSTPEFLDSWIPGILDFH